MRICKIKGCGKKLSAKGYCMCHYHKYGMPAIPCKKKGCKGKRLSKGLCHAHYERSRYISKKTKKCANEKCAVKIYSNDTYCSTCRSNAEGCKKRGVPIGTKLNKGKHNVHWNGGTSEYPNHHDMKKARLVKLKQVGCKCEECGKRRPKKKLVIHHLDEGKNNHALDNLKLLCGKCHMGIYHKGRISRPRKMINGYTVKEIATKVGSTITTVYSHLSRERFSKKYGAAIDKLTGAA